METIKETVLITGINSGMGFETAKAILKKGYTVVGTVRDSEKSHASLRTLKSIENGHLFVYEMELSSFDSVKQCAEKIKVDRHQINILIFNAGIMTPPYSITKDGFESQFQVNYLSYFYLFTLLEKFSLANLKKVINISSLSSEKGVNKSISDFESDAYCDENSYDAMKCYRESKLAQVLFTAALNQRLKKDDIQSFAIHPGVVNTNLFYKQFNPFLKTIIQPIVWLGYATRALRTPKKGAETAIYLATHKNIEDKGIYWANKKVRKHNPIVDDKEFSKAFLDWSATIIKQSISIHQHPND